MSVEPDDFNVSFSFLPVTVGLLRRRRLISLLLLMLLWLLCVCVRVVVALLRLRRCRRLRGLLTPLPALLLSILVTKVVGVILVMLAMLSLALAVGIVVASVPGIVVVGVVLLVPRHAGCRSVPDQGEAQEQTVTMAADFLCITSAAAEVLVVDVYYF